MNDHVGKPCTLNGKPATISGRRCPFGRVTALVDGESYEWSWTTIDRVMRNGGTFKS